MLSVGRIGRASRLLAQFRWLCVCRVAIIESGCSSSGVCCGVCIPPDVWVRVDQPTLAWMSPTTSKPFACIEVVEPPGGETGGVKIRYTIVSYRLFCDEIGRGRVSSKWSKVYRVVESRFRADGVEWLRCKAD